MSAKLKPLRAKNMQHFKVSDFKQRPYGTLKIVDLAKHISNLVPWCLNSSKVIR